MIHQNDVILCNGSNLAVIFVFRPIRAGRGRLRAPYEGATWNQTWIYFPLVKIWSVIYQNDVILCNGSNFAVLLSMFVHFFFIFLTGFWPPSTWPIWRVNCPLLEKGGLCHYKYYIAINGCGWIVLIVWYLFWLNSNLENSWLELQNDR